MTQMTKCSFWIWFPLAILCPCQLYHWSFALNARNLRTPVGPASEVFQLFYESITVVPVVTVTCKETHQPSNQIDSLNLQPYKSSSPKAFSPTPTAKSCWCSSSTVDHGTRKKCKLVNKMLSLKWAAHCGQIPMQSIQVKNPGDYHHSESQHDFDMITPTGCLSSGVVWKCFEETATPFGKYIDRASKVAKFVKRLQSSHCIKPQPLQSG